MFWAAGQRFEDQRTLGMVLFHQIAQGGLNGIDVALLGPHHQALEQDFLPVRLFANALKGEMEKCGARCCHLAARVVTERKPTEPEWGEMLFAWKVCKHVRSNAIVIGKDLATVGIGAGQMSRVDSVQIAVAKARRELDGAALASDAFFPFADGPEVAIEAGVKYSPPFCPSAMANLPKKYS